MLYVLQLPYMTVCHLPTEWTDDPYIFHFNVCQLYETSVRLMASENLKLTVAATTTIHFSIQLQAVTVTLVSNVSLTHIHFKYTGS